MPDGDKSLHALRREFYRALVVVWLYIMLIIGDLFRVEGRWSTGLLWAGSLLMMVVYGVMTLRSDRSRQSGKSNA